MGLRLLLFLPFVASLGLCTFEGVLTDPGTYFRLQHRYSYRNGSSKSNRGLGATLEHLSFLRRHDRFRHRRILATVAASFPVGGIADPSVAGLYFTEIQLGTPLSKYYVQVDTGSDLLWLNCATCNTCPTSTDLGVHLALYDPASSSSSNIVSCGDAFCDLASSPGCTAGHICGYQLGYGDGSSSQGYFVQDSLQLDLITGNPSVNSVNASISFGCGTTQSGELQQEEQALDGIIGFGQSNNLSVIEQLVSQGKTPGIFAHCLQGEGSGGGMLVIGTVEEPGLVYTPIIQNQIHYNVNLKSISIGGKTLSIDSSTDSSGQSKGTIFDSGTTLAYFTEPTYGHLIDAILQAGPNGLAYAMLEGMTCIVYTGSLDSAFPSIKFTFSGQEAIMEVQPHDYFIRTQTSTDPVWCIGFQSPTQGNSNLVILGDLVLKNKLVVYDLVEQQIGWVNYNCSTDVTVSVSKSQTKKVVASAIGSISNSCHSCCLSIETVVSTLLLMCTTIMALKMFNV
eukprot:c23357_g1_i1 orf=494-2020(-)